MRTVIKIILIGFGFILMVIPFGILKSLNTFTSGFTGILVTVLIFGFLAGARAIWRYNPDKNDKDKNQLNKN